MSASYDIIIGGGGLSGLFAAVTLSHHYKVLVIDTDDYPRHKMCGEYLSAEVQELLTNQNINLKNLTSVCISQFEISTLEDSTISAQLPLGGFGISRYHLDNALYQEALKRCEFVKDRVVDLKSNNNIQTVTTANNSFTCKQVILATGKRSLLDKKLGRDFIKTKSEWLAVKMHYEYDMPDDKVELHNFEGGYAGLSRLETGAVNLCYLTSYESFKKYKDIDAFQREVLCQNIKLQQFFAAAKPLWEKPIAISQIAFGSKQINNTDFLFIGDSAGLIHPLCGNGMAMAIHSAHLATKQVSRFLQGKTDRPTMIQSYTKEWNKAFKSRMRYGSWIQKILIHKRWTRVMYQLISRMPFLLPVIIRKTHGKSVQP
ncbi:Dehydrogenase (flavoprotein) [Nonlabens sp. Hel1_33_55]|uniref:NAD(P)/FAD-dependent oxidoreductase n=1 Tax=Nonlabens sp. Hel1_33_55 TaxID=1336802 RepID=UPI000875EFCD|nr:FAD-dependent monooxygenase [Nonlabens sp. Hel1_33_55]SCY05033.1 Dehydrogenase (flavoprotein) [Nonlabens sp. Hel1_33_55]